MKTKFANLILCLTLVAVAINTCVIVAAPAAAQSAPTYTVVRTMVLGGDGGAKDDHRRRLGQTAGGERPIARDLDMPWLWREVWSDAQGCPRVSRQRPEGDEVA